MKEECFHSLEALTDQSYCSRTNICPSGWKLGSGHSVLFNICNICTVETAEWTATLLPSAENWKPVQMYGIGEIPAKNIHSNKTLQSPIYIYDILLNGLKIIQYENAKHCPCGKWAARKKRKRSEAGEVDGHTDGQRRPKWWDCMFSDAWGEKKRNALLK